MADKRRAMSHTPEPWHYKDDGEPNNIDILAGDGKYDERRVIAEVYCPPMPEECNVPDRPECEANARLIALAPEMLDALLAQERLEQYEMDGINTNESELSEWSMLIADAHEKREKVLRMLEDKS